MNAKTKKTVGIALVVIGIVTVGYFLIVKPRKEKMSNAAGNQIGKGFAKSGACNGPCPPGKVCSKGQCI